VEGQGPQQVPRNVGQAQAHPRERGKLDTLAMCPLKHQDREFVKKHYKQTSSHPPESFRAHQMQTWTNIIDTITTTGTHKANAQPSKTK